MQCGQAGTVVESMVSPTLRRKRLARLLRELRDQACLTIEEAAERIDISRSAMSRAENALVGVKPMMVRDLARAYNVDSATTATLLNLARDANKKGWWQDFTSVLTDGDTTYIGFEEEASSIQSYQTLLVPGILQTADYARAIFQAYKGDRDTPRDRPSRRRPSSPTGTPRRARVLGDPGGRRHPPAGGQPGRPS